MGTTPPNTRRNNIVVAPGDPAGRYTVSGGTIVIGPGTGSAVPAPPLPNVGVEGQVLQSDGSAIVFGNIDAGEF